MYCYFVTKWYKAFHLDLEHVKSQKEIYNPENTITDSQKHIIFNHIYRHYVFHTVKNINDFPVSVNVKIQGLPGTSKTFIVNTIRNIDIMLKPMFLSYTCCAPTGCVASLTNRTAHHHLFNISIGKKSILLLQIGIKKYFFNIS